MARLNSAGRCNAITDHTGSLARPSAVRRKRVYIVLQVLGGRRVPPEHEVRVGSQTGHVVAATGDHVLVRRLGEQLLDLLDQALPGLAGNRSRTRKTDHMV